MSHLHPSNAGSFDSPPPRAVSRYSSIDELNQGASRHVLSDSSALLPHFVGSATRASGEFPTSTLALSRPPGSAPRVKGAPPLQFREPPGARELLQRTEGAASAAAAGAQARDHAAAAAESSHPPASASASVPAVAATPVAAAPSSTPNHPIRTVSVAARSPNNPAAADGPHPRPTHVHPQRPIHSAHAPPTTRAELFASIVAPAPAQRYAPPGAPVTSAVQPASAAASTDTSLTEQERGGGRDGGDRRGSGSTSSTRSHSDRSTSAGPAPTHLRVHPPMSRDSSLASIHTLPLPTPAVKPPTALPPLSHAPPMPLTPLPQQLPLGSQQPLPPQPPQQLHPPPQFASQPPPLQQAQQHQAHQPPHPPYPFPPAPVPGRPYFQPMMVMMMPAGPPGAPFQPFAMQPPPPMQQQGQQQQQPFQQQPPQHQQQQVGSQRSGQPQLAQQHPSQPQPHPSQLPIQRPHAPPSAPPSMPGQPVSPNSSAPLSEEPRTQDGRGPGPVGSSSAADLRSPSAQTRVDSPSAREEAATAAAAAEEDEEGVDLATLPSLDSRTEKGRSGLYPTEVSLAAQRRVERDRTMLALWVLASLLLLTLTFHAHRFQADQAHDSWPSSFVHAALGLGIVAGVALLLCVLLVFLGRPLAEFLTGRVVLLHAFLGWMASFLLYLPLITDKIHATSSTSGDALGLLASHDESASASASSASLLAALLLHALSLAAFYPLLLHTFSGGGVGSATSATLAGGGGTSERRELHAALLALEQAESSLRGRGDEASKERSARIALERQVASERAAHSLSLQRASSHLREVESSRDQLAQILDGLESHASTAARAAKVRDETVAHLQKNHAAEVATLLAEARARQEFSQALGRELDVAKDALLRERKRSHALASELDLLRLQAGGKGMEDSRVALLQAQMDAVVHESDANFAELQQARVQLLAQAKGNCLHCEEMQSKLQGMHGQQAAHLRLAEQNVQLRSQLKHLQSELAEVRERQAQVDGRTQRKVARIEHDLEEFDAFVAKMKPED